MTTHVAHGKARQKILEAAKERLWHYGFKKTTIDEIAADAGVGKGTVYLYFESKEDIALAIIERYKVENLEEIGQVAHDLAKPVVERLKEILTLPLLRAHERCLASPAGLEMVLAIRPHIEARMLPYLKQEVDLIAAVLNEGNRTGVLDVENPTQVARTMKAMCAGFWPPYPFVQGCEAISQEIERIVNLVYQGLRKSNSDAAHGVGRNKDAGTGARHLYAENE